MVKGCQTASERCAWNRSCSAAFQAYFMSKQYRRVLLLLRNERLLNANIHFRYLAAKVNATICLLKQNVLSYVWCHESSSGDETVNKGLSVEKHIRS